MRTEAFETLEDAKAEMKELIEYREAWRLSYDFDIYEKVGQGDGYGKIYGIPQ